MGPTWPWSFYRATDINPFAQQFMTQAEPFFVAKHNFGDICHKIPPSKRRFLVDRRPLPKTPVAAAKVGWARFGESLRANSAELFRADSTQYCITHEKHCLIHPPGVVEKGPRLSLAGAGSMCTPFSQIGARKGLGDQQMESFKIWVEERRTMQEDMIFHENSVHFPKQELLDEPLISVGYQVRAVNVSPLELGEPFDRMRQFVFANHPRLVWIGPTSYQEDFHRLFDRICILDGNSYFVESPDAVRAHLRDRLQARHVHLQADATLQEHLDKAIYTLPGWMRVNLKKYTDLRPALQSMDGAFLVDLGQDAEERKSCGPYFPRCLTHGTHWSFNKGRSATSRESLLTVGISALLDEQNEFLFENLLKSLQVDGKLNHVVAKMVGDAMSCSAAAAWVFYNMAFLVKRDDVTTALSSGAICSDLSRTQVSSDDITDDE